MNRFIYATLRALILLALVWLGMMLLIGSARQLFGGLPSTSMSKPQWSPVTGQRKRSERRW